MIKKNAKSKTIYPGGKHFAFSIFDDTDVATLDYIQPLYDYLYDLGLLTTKTIWCLDYEGKSIFQGTDTLSNPKYADYIKKLQKRGFEIGYHGATMESSTRDKIKKSLKRYHEILGKYPTTYSAHSLNQDNLYWGEHRFTFKLTRWLYRILSNEKPDYFQGHLENSPYFWGDLAKQNIEYVRSFTFTTPNLLSLGLPVVYQNGATPWVNNWFLTCDAENVEEFNSLISTKNQQKLEDEGGLCIVSTHFGKGFIDRGDVHATTKRLLRELSERDGWFAPVSDILNFYSKQVGSSRIRKSKLLQLELRFLTDSRKRKRIQKNYTVTEAEYLKRNMRIPSD